DLGAEQRADDADAGWSDSLGFLRGCSQNALDRIAIEAPLIGLVGAGRCDVADRIRHAGHLRPPTALAARHTHRTLLARHEDLAPLVKTGNNGLDDGIGRGFRARSGMEEKKKEEAG